MDNCPYCDIFPVMCKCCGEVLSDIKHPVPAKPDSLKGLSATLNCDFIPESEHYETGYWNLKKGTKVYITGNESDGTCYIEYLDAGFTIDGSKLTTLHPVPDASQPAAGYSLQQVADAFEAGAENEYEKHFGAIPPLSLNKETYLASSQPAGNEAVTYTQEQIITALMQCGYSIVDREEILQSL